MQTYAGSSSPRGKPPSRRILYDNLEWAGFKAATNWVVLVDDVITTGGRFKACQPIILEKCPGIRVVGAFWAKTVWPDTEEAL